MAGLSQTGIPHAGIHLRSSSPDVPGLLPEWPKRMNLIAGASLPQPYDLIVVGIVPTLRFLPRLHVFFCCSRFGNMLLTSLVSPWLPWIAPSASSATCC